MRVVRGVLLPSALAWLGCSPNVPARIGGPVGEPAALEIADRGSCTDGKDPLRPLIVGWPATSRAELETSAAEGPVVVSRAGCVLKVLAGCRAGGTSGYELEGVTPAEDRLDIENTRDLDADLPLGVATLKGKFEEGTRLTLSYVTVGARALRQAPSVLQGDCEGATHYVGSLVLGAFSLESRRVEAGSASARIGGARAGGGTQSNEQLSGSAGDLAACRARGLAAGSVCQAVLALWLRPLQLVDGKPLAAGFGLGLAPPSIVPTVSPLSIARADGAGAAGDAGGAGGDLARIDVTLLELLQAALDADRRASLASASKAQAWDRLARYAASDRYAAVAARRRDEWLRQAQAERAREAQLVGLCPRYHVERSKLDRLLHLGAGVLADRDKQLYKKEFDEAYAPWPEVERCAELEAAAAAREAWPALQGANDGMVRVRGGTFAMGSTAPEDHAAPVHLVAVRDFEMDVTEVTVEAYARCQRAGVCSQRGSYVGDDTWRCTDNHRLTPYGPSGGESRDQAPANCMTFAQAAAYCRWAGKRLPTEEEWEYAARGTDGRRYPWGEWAKDSDGHPFFSHHYCAVPGSDPGYRAGSIATNTSAFGLRDMAGGVWEWTTGRFSTRYDTPPTTQERVLRGGEFGWSNEADCRSYGTAYRFSHEPKYADSNLGARCAR